MPAPIAERYARAAARTAPKVAARTPGIAVDGYWLDEHTYFFVQEALEPDIGVVGFPAIADARTNRVEPVMPLEEIARLLGECDGSAIDRQALASAEFDLLDRNTLTVSVAGRTYRIDVQPKKARVAGDALKVPALYAPDGRHACFVSDCDLWIKDLRSGEERALTTDGTPFRRYAQQSEACLVTISYREKPYPVGLWSSDSQWFLTHFIEEGGVPESGLIQNAPPGGGRPVRHTFKFAMPGDPMPMATYVAIHIPTGRRIVFENFATPVVAFSPFSFRAAWFDGTDTAWVTRMDRYSKRAELLRLDLTKAAARVAIAETASEGYLDLHPSLFATPNVRSLAASNEAIWFSERDGWGHLYLYDVASGQLKNRITSGRWLVRDIVHVDERRRRILFLAGGVAVDSRSDTAVDPARRSLCTVNLDGSGFQVLVSHDGDVFVPQTEPTGIDQYRAGRPSYANPGVSPGGARFGVVRYNSVTRGNRTEILDLESLQGFPLAASAPRAGEIPPQHFQALAADGVTRLHGVMFFPSDFDPKHRYPLIDDIYPGPQMTQQPQAFCTVWSAEAKALAELGFVTIMLDSRGVPTRSRAFHQIGYPELLEPQLSDHAAVVRQLCERHSFIDAQRVGICGWSAGGFATARALCDYGHVYKVGVSACGNHDSTYYSTVWSDKYRGPGDRTAWDRQSNKAVAHKLAGKLLLITGDMDENVHSSHTLAFVNALIEANRDFDLLVIPNEAHYVMITSGYAQRRAWDYFVRHLLDEAPPSNFPLHFEAFELARCMKNYWREFRQ